MKEQHRRSETYYAEPVYRLPSETYSLLVQATLGCSSAAASRCYLPLRGVLPGDKERPLKTIRGAMKDPSLLRAEYTRGL
jgi:hypothetical protein